MYAFGPYSSLPYSVVPAYPSSVDVNERCLILSPRDSDRAVLTASSELTSLPAVNLQNMQPAKKWRGATNVREVYFELAFELPIAANMVALIASNLSGSATVRVRASTTQAGLTTSPDVDTGAMWIWPSSGKTIVPDWPSTIGMARWSVSGAYSYWRVDVAEPSLALSYLEIGRLMLGTYWQPSINFDVDGTPLAFDSVDVQTITPYGRLFTDRRMISPSRTFELRFTALTKREAFDGVMEVQRLRGMHGDLLCVLDPGATIDLHRYAMQGVFMDKAAYPLPAAYDDNGNMFGAGIRMRELIP